MTTQITEKALVEDLAITSDGFPESISRGKLIFSRFMHNKLALTGAIVILLMSFTAFLLPYFLPFSPTHIDKEHLAEPPNLRHLWGTNLIGQDVLSQTLSGLRKSLIIAFSVAIISTFVAAVVGSIAGYFSGISDKVLMFIADALMVVPSFLIISISTTKFRYSSYLILVVFLAGFSWMLSARMVRSITLSIKERDYIHAAEFMGANRFTIIFRHILPNMASVLIADVTLNIGSAVIGEAGLSYFGFGVQPPDVSLGTLIADGAESALSYPWLFLWCCGCLTLLVLASNLVGDGLRDAFDSSSQGSDK